jgi:hypothetical protein
MADYQSYLSVRFVDDNFHSAFGVITISTNSIVFFRGEEIKITEIENYVSKIENELLAVHVSQNEVHSKELENLKRYYESHITSLQETIAQIEARHKHE